MIQISEIIKKMERNFIMREKLFIYLKKKIFQSSLGGKWNKEEDVGKGERIKEENLLRVFNALCGNLCYGVPLPLFANHSYSQAYLEFFRKG